MTAPDERPWESWTLPDTPPSVPDVPPGWFDRPAPPAPPPATFVPVPADQRRASAGRWAAAGAIALVVGLTGTALCVAAGFVWFWVALLATDPHDPDGGGAFLGWFVIGVALLAAVAVALVGVVLLAVGGARRAAQAIP